MIWFPCGVLILQRSLFAAGGRCLFAGGVGGLGVTAGRLVAFPAAVFAAADTVGFGAGGLGVVDVRGAVEPVFVTSVFAAVDAGGESAEIAELDQICESVSLFISNSIVPLPRTSGCAGTAMSLPLINSFTFDASERL